LITNFPQVTAVKLGAASLGGLFAFIATEVTTGQVIFGAIIALVSAVAAASITSLPAFLQARRADRDQSFAFLKDQLSFQRQMIALMRKSKHNLSDELQNAYARIRLMELNPKATCEPYRFKTNEELCGEEDTAAIELSLSLEAFSVNR
jgi:hypothetical protein